MTCGILQLLKNKGKKVAAFKCGPDYIDPMFHRTVLGLPSRNLDVFFSGEELTKELFARAQEGMDISVIEGVMGYFDGVEAPGNAMLASSYDLARVTETPVILVLDAKGMSRSVVPLVKGFLEYGDSRQIKGVILNRASKGMYPVLKKYLEDELPVKALGYLPPLEGSLWESRHLGLVQADEIKDLKEQVNKIAEVLSETLDLDGLLALAAQAPVLNVQETEIAPLETHPIIGVAKDEAFSFYYEDNLDLFKRLGAKLVFFSPLHDEKLPEADGLYFGGGYPELYAKELSENVSMCNAVKKAAADGMPVLAECGGFMYLQEALRPKEGGNYPMAGALPGSTHMTEKLVRFGYLSLSAKEENPYLPLGEEIRGHEFHYFDSEQNGTSCIAKKPSGKRQWECIAAQGNIFAGFPHLYYYSNIGFAKRFLERCAG
ncbi:MAG: cobyrinate a,c-diamide synthase [Lachnospiraceae bacterium]|nr:cobyrinate a,c-diamide synthase [Lachnospiraceae bacterium]